MSFYLCTLFFPQSSVRDPDRSSTISTTVDAVQPGMSVAAFIEASLDADKGEDIIVLDLRGKSSFADTMIICSGRSPRHVAAMADHLQEKLKGMGLYAQVEGTQTCDWVLLDAGDVVVHLFRPEVRAFYNLEKMWGGTSLSAPVGEKSSRDAYAASLGVPGPDSADFS